MRSGDAEKVLARLGIEYEQRGRELLALCPGHLKNTGRVDHNPSWSINEETGAHHCFSCGYRGGLLSLICDLLDFTDFDLAKRWLEANVEVDLDALVKDVKAVAQDQYRYIPKPVPMTEARLAIFSDPPAWALEKRNLTLESAKEHGVRWAEGFDNWILPIRDPETYKLLGWQEKGQGHKHVKNRPAGMKKALTLFGIDKFKDLSLKEMIIVESPLDCARLSSVGVHGGVASFGSSVSLEQIKLLRRADIVTIAMDDDPPGIKATKQISNLCRRYGIEYKYFNYGETGAKDIGDMLDDEIIEGLATAKHMALGRLAFL